MYVSRNTNMWNAAGSAILILILKKIKLKKIVHHTFDNAIEAKSYSKLVWSFLGSKSWKQAKEYLKIRKERECCVAEFFSKPHLIKCILQPVGRCAASRWMIKMLKRYTELHLDFINLWNSSIYKNISVTGVIFLQNDTFNRALQYYEIVLLLCQKHPSTLPAL